MNLKTGFKKKLYKALNVPITRMESETNFNLGRASEITRDEVKFFRFIDRLRQRFSEVFLQALRAQVILRGIMKKEDWEKIFQDISFRYKTESYFHELKETEILKERAEMLRDMDDYVGKYYSIDWIRKNVLKQSENEIKEMDDQIKKEMDAGQIETGEPEEEEGGEEDE